MPRTKISEFSATPANNTDIDSINIAEGCAPSGINDAIRELMAQLKDFQTGAVGDSFNGPIGTTTAAAGAFTTLSASSTLGVTGVSTLTGGAVVQGMTVGKGAGAVATNTAVGASALQASNSGNGNNTAVGYEAGRNNTTGAYNTWVGGLDFSNGLAVGRNNTTGQYNAGFGAGALANNTTASGNTAVGYQAAHTNSTGNELVAVGFEALKANTTGYSNTAVGHQASNLNTTGISNVAVGRAALYPNTTGSSNTAIGYYALVTNTTGSNNTVVGKEAGYTNSTGAQNAFFGRLSGYYTTGGFNTFLGDNAGSNISSGTKNTIIGRYDGNTGGLDIRTASNYIVLSDGDGNPRAYWNGASLTNNGNITSTGGVSIGQDVYKATNGSGTIARMGYITTASAFQISFDSTSAGVQLSSGATSWGTFSDERLKNVTGTYTNALSDIAQIQPVKFTWKSDTENKPQVGVIAQSVQVVVPEAIDSATAEMDGNTEYLQVRYTELIPLMIASIQELKAEFDAYKLTHP
jgi:hypothetical protein